MQQQESKYLIKPFKLVNALMISSTISCIYIALVTLSSTEKSSKGILNPTANIISTRLNGFSKRMVSRQFMKKNKAFFYIN